MFFLVLQVNLYLVRNSIHILIVHCHLSSLLKTNLILCLFCQQNILKRLIQQFSGVKLVRLKCHRYQRLPLITWVYCYESHSDCWWFEIFVTVNKSMTTRRRMMWLILTPSPDCININRVMFNTLMLTAADIDYL